MDLEQAVRRLLEEFSPPNLAELVLAHTTVRTGEVEVAALDAPPAVRRAVTVALRGALEPLQAHLRGTVRAVVLAAIIDLVGQVIAREIPEAVARAVAEGKAGTNADPDFAFAQYRQFSR